MTSIGRVSSRISLLALASVSRRADQRVRGLEEDLVIVITRAQYNNMMLDWNAKRVSVVGAMRVRCIDLWAQHALLYLSTSF